MGVDNSRAVDAAVSRGANREAFGGEVSFGLDFRSRVNAPMAKVLIKELELSVRCLLKSGAGGTGGILSAHGQRKHIPIAAGGVCSRVLNLSACWTWAGWRFYGHGYPRGRHYRML